MQNTQGGDMQERFTMSAKELKILTILENIIEKRLSLVQGAKQLDLTPRHLRRLKKRFLAEGVSALVSKKRGNSNSRHDPKLKDDVVSLLHEHYYDYGPTFASEKLAEHHQIYLSKECTRQWMHEAGIRQIRSEKAQKVYQPRNRRPAKGELIQMDGSIHHWFEGSADKCTLLVLIDDATSELLQLRFVKAETTFDYFDTVKEYFLSHGKPGAFYVDKHNVFNVNHAEAKSGDGYTQFSRALNTLGVPLIKANSPQAKGRVERVNQTLQDRLIKELRYRKISTKEEANEFIKTYYLASHNKRFAKIPASPDNVHVALTEEEIKGIDKLFTIQNTRKISKSLTISLRKSLYVIKNQRYPRKLVGKTVTINEYSNGKIELYLDNIALEYEIMKNYDFQQRVLGVREMHAFLDQRLTNSLIPRNKLLVYAINDHVHSGHLEPAKR